MSFQPWSCCPFLVSASVSPSLFLSLSLSLSLFLSLSLSLSLLPSLSLRALSPAPVLTCAVEGGSVSGVEAPRASPIFDWPSGAHEIPACPAQDTPIFCEESAICKLALAWDGTPIVFGIRKLRF